MKPYPSKSEESNFRWEIFLVVAVLVFHDIRTKRSATSCLKTTRQLQLRLHLHLNLLLQFCGWIQVAWNDTHLLGHGWFVQIEEKEQFSLILRLVHAEKAFCSKYSHFLQEILLPTPNHLLEMMTKLFCPHPAFSGYCDIQVREVDWMLQKWKTAGYRTSKIFYSTANCARVYGTFRC